VLSALLCVCVLYRCVVVALLCALCGCDGRLLSPFILPSLLIATKEAKKALHYRRLLEVFGNELGLTNRLADALLGAARDATGLTAHAFKCPVDHLPKADPGVVGHAHVARPLFHIVESNQVHGPRGVADGS